MAQDYLTVDAWVSLADAANLNRDKLTLTLDDIFTTAELAAKCGRYDIDYVVDLDISSEVIDYLIVQGYTVMGTAPESNDTILVLNISTRTNAEVPA